jgi:hypothetical protein
MLVTLNKVKSILDISNTDNDNFIKIQLPFVENDICIECRDHFVDMKFNFITSNLISFNSSLNSLNLNDINTKGFHVGDTIRVYNSIRNDGIFTIDTINQNSLILNDIDEVEDEDAGELIYITRIKYPKALKKVAALMIDFKIKENENESQGIKKEKIDDYSVEYEDKSQGYPSSILSMLYNYRQLYNQTLFTVWDHLVD